MSNTWDGPDSVWDSIDNGRLKQQPKAAKPAPSQNDSLRRLLFKGPFARLGDRVQDALSPKRG